MPALQRAVACSQVDDVAVGVSEDLDLDVPRGRQVALHVEPPVPEHRLGAGSGLGVGPQERVGIVHHAHPAPTTTGHRLDDDRVPDLGGELRRLVGVFERVPAARQEGQPRVQHDRTGAGLVTETAHHRCRRPDEGDALLLAHLGEVRVLRQESVAGVDGVGTSAPRRLDDGGDVEVAGLCRPRPDLHRLVGELDNRRVTVGGGVDRHRGQTEFAAGAGDPERDLATVGDQHFFDHRPESGRSAFAVATASRG